MEMTLAQALAGGFKTFFSIWQLCIMQITPFYLAFLLGAYFSLPRKNARDSLVMMFFVFAGLLIGFSVVFSFAASPSTAPGGVILRNLKTLRFFSGVFILASGALMIVFASVARFDAKAKVIALFSPFAGASLAVAYSPCIAPALSRILNFAAVPGNSARGLLLLFLYGAGLALALSSVAAVLMAIARVKTGRKAVRSITPVVIACLVYMTIGVLLVSGLMLKYKTVLVNLF